jgi:hemerythrin-like domain-containing protein
MMPIGPMMIEHRLIEKGIELVGAESDRLRGHGALDPLYIDALVDFIRTYADRTHHGKEEDILFRDLARKKLSDGDRRIMGELTEEHAFARKTVAALVAAKERCLAGDGQALTVVADSMADLYGLYPPHIRKEDKIFFPASMKYFSRAEMDAMLAEMEKFDQKMIHEKYASVVQKWQKR